MLYPGRVVAVDGHRRVIERGQQVLADVPDLCRIIQETFQNVVQMGAVHLHETALHDFPGLIVPADPYRFRRGAADIDHKLLDFIDLPDMIRVILPVKIL